MIQKESGFSRTQVNIAKAGAYYTDAGHAARIGRMFAFPYETCILEPCIGDASAVRSLLGQSLKGDGPLHVFGVEINQDVANKVEEEQGAEYLLNADFLTEIKATNKAFTFCFANPPYMETGEGHEERMEQRFVERIFQYLRPGGYLVLIISYPTLCIERFEKSLLARFEWLGLFRFDDKEYAKFKQVVFIGRRKRTVGLHTSEFARFEEASRIEQIPYLPDPDETVGECFEVPESRSQNIDIFMRAQFDPVSSAKRLEDSQLYNMLERKLFIEKYVGLDIGRPVLPLKKDFYYICAVTGGGQGIVGSDENHDMHLQRGCARRIEKNEIASNERSGQDTLKIRSSTEITITIIENDGTITRL